MAHDIIIIITKGNCVATKTTQLMGYAVALDAILTNSLPSNEEDFHDLLERIQTFFVSSCEGASLVEDDTLDDLIDDAETLLEI